MQLVADHLEKKFGAVTAVADVSFAATPGEVLGLLGPNGAGKSTTISMLAGLTKPDSGSVTIDGVALGTGADPTTRRLGLVTQEIALLEELPAHESGILRRLIRPGWPGAGGENRGGAGTYQPYGPRR
jgi:ABC-2 type transport system ATP-binding protein